MNKAGFLFLGAMMSLGSLALVGCGGDDTTGTGGTGGASTSASSSSSSSSASASASGSSSSGGGTAATCKSFCTANLAACKDANAQWDATNCEAVCTKAAFPQGKIGDTTGDTLECRAYHTGAAAMNAATHCGHSGLNGGDFDPTVAGGMQCGDVVESFCRLAMAACTGTNAQWMDLATCKTDVAKFAKGAAAFSFTADATSKKNDINCRTYHLLRAAESDMNATTHCPHIGVMSMTCNM